MRRMLSTEAGGILLRQEILDRAAVEAPQLHRAERRKDVAVELPSVAGQRRCLEAAAECEPTLGVVPDDNVRVHRRDESLAGRRQRSSERGLGLMLGSVALPPPPAEGIPVVQDPTSAPPTDTSHSVSLASPKPTAFVRFDPAPQTRKTNPHVSLADAYRWNLTASAQLTGVLLRDAEQLRHLRHVC